MREKGYGGRMGGEITSLSATCQHVSSGCVVEEGIQTVGFSISAKMVGFVVLVFFRDAC